MFKAKRQIERVGTSYLKQTIVHIKLKGHALRRNKAIIK